jgi:hypothetical protein
VSDPIQNLVEVIRQQESQNTETLKDQVRALIEKYRGNEAGRQATLDKLVEEGEYEGTYAYDSALTDNEGDAADDLGGLLRQLSELVGA